MNNTSKGDEFYKEIQDKIETLKEGDENPHAHFARFWKMASDAKMNAYLKYNKEKVEKLRERIRPMREEFVNDMEKYVQAALKSLKTTNAKVHLAKTSQEAIDLFFQELGNEKRIVKSKSNDAKEIGLLKALKDKGIEVIETDAGDVIIQLTGERSQWQFGPAAHVEFEKIVSAIKEKYGVDVPPVEEDIVEFIRNTYKDVIMKTRVCLTSANAIAADDGTIALIENEGNISLITRLADKHIVVAGITKIVPTLYDAVAVCNACESIVSILGAYISLIRGPSNTADVRGKKVVGMYGAKEVVVILVDDWRTGIKGTFLEDFLHCINCKACSLVCTALTTVGDFFRSDIALGAYGIIKDYIHNGIESAVKNGLYLCTNCKNCYNFCPAGVDLGGILMEMKKEARQKGLAPSKLEGYLENIKQNMNPFDGSR
ncbi:MAG: LUD domain-containing protein [Candidatus Hodarchaeota archaeon]